jgi:Mg2+ and Co2+ transporter CorA
VTIAGLETRHFDNVKEWYLGQMEELESDETYKLSPYYVLYKIIDVMHDKVIRGLRLFARDLRSMEEEVFDETFNTKTVSAITIKRRNVVTIKHALLPQVEILEELQSLVMKKM